MVINPRVAVEQGWLYVDKDMPPIDPDLQVQQNGVDLRLDEVYEIDQGLLVEENTKLAYKHFLGATNNRYRLEPGRAYNFSCVESVKVPPDCCAMLFMRSTLNEMGCQVAAGLYDSGYNNRVFAAFYPQSPVTIARYQRVLQIVFLRADAASLYTGHNQLEMSREVNEAIEEDVKQFEVVVSEMAGIYKSRAYDFGPLWLDQSLEHLVEMAEEKVNRIKHAPSFEKKVDACLDAACYSLICLRKLRSTRSVQHEVE